jgi:hypothetical protein
MTGPGLLVRVGLLLVLATAAIGTPADADLWGHLRFGRDILTSGHIVQPDAYAFTSDRPWVNHEWLAEVSFAEAYRIAGSPGLVGLKLAIIAALCALLWWHLGRARSAAPALDVLLTLAFAGTYWRMHTVRPQLFSVLFFAVLLVVMTLADQGRRRILFIVPPLMALWVNLHGGWIVGLGVLGIWTAMRVIDGRMSIRERLFVAGAGLAAVSATLLNPYGAHMWAFLGETVRLGRADIEEWGSVLTYPAALGVPWAIVLTIAAIAVWRAGRPRRFDYVAIVTLLAIASFRVSRLDAFFTVAVVILLAPELTSLIGRATNRSRVADEPTVRRAAAPAAGVIAITVVAVGVMLVPAARVAAPYANCLTIAGPWVPDAEAGRFIARNQLKGRMLTWFDWGEYAIWHFGPDLRVSMDGRRETVYTDATIQAHRRFYAGDDSAMPYLHTLDPDFIWLPVRLPVTVQISSEGWTPVFTGSTSVVFARAGAGPFQQLGNSSAAVRCFPGP